MRHGLGMGLRHGLEDGLGLRHGLEALGREGWLGLSNGKKRYSVRLENKSQTNQKISHFLAPLGKERCFCFLLGSVFKFYQLPLFFPLLSPSHPSPPCLEPSHPSLPHASSPCLKPSPSSSPCRTPLPRPCLKPIPLFHVSSPGTPSFLGLQSLSLVFEGFFNIF